MRPNHQSLSTELTRHLLNWQSVFLKSVETERLIRSHCCSQQFKLKLCTLRANTNWLVVLSMWSDLQSMLTPHQDEAPSKLNDTSSEVHLWSQPSWWGTPKLFNAPCGSAVWRRWQGFILLLQQCKLKLTMLSAKRVASSWHEIRWLISFSATNNAPPRWFHAQCFCCWGEENVRSHHCCNLF